MVRPIALALLLSAPLASAADPLESKMAAVIGGPDYKQAKWGILVTDAQTGEVLFARNPDTLMTPASTTKLYSCAAILLAYGPEFRFETPVFRQGDVTSNGTLQGNLILRASGDPSFGGRTTKDGKLAFKDKDHSYANSGLMESELTDTNPLLALEDLARQVKAAGIHHVAGEVWIDDRLYNRASATGSGPDAVTPIMVNDNVVDILVVPGAHPNEPAKVTVRPETSAIRLDADVRTVEKNSTSSILLSSPVPGQLVVRGGIPAEAKPQVRIFPVDEPALFARTLFIEALRKEGVRVSAATARPAFVDLPKSSDYANLTQVAIHKSPPLTELIQVILKVSHNLYASALPCLVAVKYGQRSLEAGLREQGKLLKDLGVDVSTISFGGGAGGAASDCVTPRATVQLLSAMAKRPEWPAYKAALPSLGVDGTLAEAVPAESPARGRAFAKTGTLIWRDEMNGRFLLRSKALAGTMKTKSERELFLALFVNDVPLPPGVGSSREGKVLGKLCEVLFENVP